LFDVPTTQNSRRSRLRRYLRARGFGCLQNSVWITPDALDEERQIVRGSKVDVESLILLDGRPCSGESDSEIVGGAWDFESINSRYERHLKVLDDRPTRAVRKEGIAQALLNWAEAEREAWLEAVGNDPLLPKSLLPPDYLGRRAWQRRIKVLRDAGRQLQTFRLN
jgi:DNA-binding transcriptional regulator PaaX